MERQIATTQDQSARLLRCGVPADTADTYWDNHTIDEPFLVIGEVEDKRDTPAWSLSALLGLLPKEMGIAIGAYPGSDKYTCFTLIDPDIEPIVADTAIEAAMQMIEQLTNNGYKFNEI